MIRLRLSGKVLLLLLVVPCLLLLYALLSSMAKEPVQPAVATTPATLGLGVFRRQEDKPEDVLSDVSVKDRRRSVVQPRREVEVWGKASIAEYLWSHILGGNATTYANGLLKHGEISLGDMHLRFRSGPGIIQNTVPNTVKYLVLVINGKDELKIRFSRSWLDYLVHFRYLRRTALVVLGDEGCDNQWLQPYLRSRGGVVDVIFLVYDSPLIDGREVIQWPLGVATYRGFPQFRSDLINIKNERQHLCNFFGTVYKNSSREALVNLLTNNRSSKCHLQTRDTWIPTETYASMEKYLRIVSDSDLTLNPVGKNTECYRIYEALALGSVPIVEDVVTPGQCVAPLRLLKQYDAPVIFVKNWTEVSSILEAESLRSLKSRVSRRKRVVKWYENFKSEMRMLFLKTLRKIFFQREDRNDVVKIVN